MELMELGPMELVSGVMSILVIITFLILSESLSGASVSSVVMVVSLIIIMVYSSLLSGILTAILMIILLWEFIIKPVLKDRVRKKLYKTLSPEKLKSTPQINPFLEIIQNKNKFLLMDGERVVVSCDNENKARELQSLWMKHMNELNEDMLR